MIKKIVFISILILWGCDSLNENTIPLGGEFYIEDAWIAFSFQDYDESDKHFNTAIDTNDSGSVIHFLSLVGLGWINIYEAQVIEETSSNGLIKIAGERLDLANNIMLNINLNDIPLELHGDYFKGRTHLYAGLTIQRSYYAKQLAVNGVNWETNNVALSELVRILYEESIEYSKQLESDFIFQHDENLRFNDILVLRTENYLIIGNIEEAILSYNQIDFDQLDFEVNEECKEGVDSSTLVECLCIVSHDGICPFGD